MNLKDLVAIDVHTHAWKSALPVGRHADRVAGGDGALFPLPAAARDGAGDGGVLPQAEDGVRGLHRGLAARQKRKITNEEIAELAHKHADVAIPFASINPHRGARGRRRGAGD